MPETTPSANGAGHSFRDMPLWQRSMRLAGEIYQTTAQLPAAERLGLSANLQQAAVSIPTLLASGSKGSRSGFQHACLQARQAAAEVETLLLIIQQAYSNLPVDDLLSEIADIQTGLTNLVIRIGQKTSGASTRII